MSKQYILKDIEKLKRANTFLETLFADIEKYKDNISKTYSKISLDETKDEILRIRK